MKYKEKEINSPVIYTEAQKKLGTYLALVLLAFGVADTAQAQDKTPSLIAPTPTTGEITLPPQEEETTENGSPGRLITQAKVNVRKAPSTTADVLRQLSPSTELDFTESRAGDSVQRNSTWHAISLPDGEQGWVWDGAVRILEYPTEPAEEPLSEDERTALIEQGYVGFDRAEFGPTLPVQASEIEPYLIREYELPLTPDLFAEYPDAELTKILESNVSEGIGMVPTVYGKQHYNQMGVYPVPDINGDVAKLVPVTDSDGQEHLALALNAVTQDREGSPSAHTLYIGYEGLTFRFRNGYSRIVDQAFVDDLNDMYDNYHPIGWATVIKDVKRYTGSSPWSFTASLSHTETPYTFLVIPKDE
jgi:hypothetical protein